MTPLTTLGLAFAIAVLYVVTTYMMKVSTELPVWVFAPVLAATLIAAIVLEIHVLKTQRMGSIFVLILSLEVILTMVCAYWVLGENYSLREMAGLAIIVAGIAVAWWPEDVPAPHRKSGAMIGAADVRLAIPVSVEMPRAVKPLMREM